MNRLVFFFTIFLTCNLSAQKRPRVTNIDEHDFFALTDTCKTAVIFDVRANNAFYKNRVNGAFYVENSEILGKITDTLDFNTVLVLYCEVGQRSSTASKMLVKKGFKKVYNLKNGIDTYINKGYKIDTSAIKSYNIKKQ